MRKLAIGLSVALVMTVLSTMGVAAKDRKTTIHITKNYNTTGTIKAECRATVATDPIPAVKTDKIMWQVQQGNGQSSDDDCPSLMNTMVELRFNDDVMGSSAGRKLTANG